MTWVNDDKWIVVTGGAGFIGSCMVRYLNDRGLTNIVVIDDIGRSERWKNLVGKRFLELVQISELFTWLQGKHEDIQAFIHLGACSDTWETDGQLLMGNNYRFTMRLAEYALHHKHRFIYASSAATYGDGQFGFFDAHDRISQLRPLNLYGYSKQLFDLWAYSQGVLEDMVGLKFFNVFGPNEQHKGRMASAIVKMVPSALNEGVIRLFRSTSADFADGEQRRDFAYVKDVVEMVYSFLESEAGGIYNIGSGEAQTWNELAGAVIQALGRPVSIEYIDMPTELASKYQNYTCADMAKFRSHPELTFKHTPLEDAVADYIHNYLLPDVRW